MSRFYAHIQGNRGIATRQGTAKSGIEGHIRGWRIGARVTCFPSPNNEDFVDVVITGGSASPHTILNLGTYKLVDGKVIQVERD